MLVVGLAKFVELGIGVPIYGINDFQCKFGPLCNTIFAFNTNRFSFINMKMKVRVGRETMKEVTCSTYNRLQSDLG